MLISEFLGFLGGAFTSLGYIPQLLRILKLKSAHEISLPFTLFFLAGGLCWLSTEFYPIFPLLSYGTR